MGKNRRRWALLAILVSLVVAGTMACQAGPWQGASILDECNRPTVSNRDWCLSIRFPNTM